MIAARAEGWLGARGAFGRGIIAAMLGIGLALGHAPFGMPWIWLLAFPLFLLLLTTATGPRAAAWLGWLAGTGYFALSLSWIVEPFLVDIARHGWMAPFALVFLAGGLALFWALAGWLAQRITGGGGRVLLWFPLILVVLEVVRARLFTGFPWAHPAYVWIDTPLAQLAAWVGPHGLALLVLLALAALAAARWKVILGVAALCVMFLFGELQKEFKGTPSAALPLPPIVRLVQPNAAQHLKWRSDMVREFYERLLSLSAAEGSRPRALVVWPETAVPFLLDDRPDLQADIAAAAGAPVALGIRRQGAAGGWYNTLAVLGSGGETLAAYDKSHLVPFGEYIPLMGALDAAGLGEMARGLAGSFQSGGGPEVIAVDGLPAFQPLICYEAIFPHEMVVDPRPDFLLQVTNDAWFGTFSGPYQHLVQARMRAIEQGLPVARAANTGISAMIDAGGHVTAQIPLGEAGFVDAALPAPRRATLYARYGDAIFAALAILAALAGFVSLRRS